MQTSTKLIALPGREIDLPGLPFRQLAASQAAAGQIVEHGLRGDPKLGCRTLDGEAAVGPAHWVGAVAIDLDGRDPPAGAQQPDILALEGAAAGSDKAFPVLCCGDHLVHPAGADELRKSSSQPFKIDIVTVGVDAPLSAMLAGRTGLPHDLQPDLTLRPPLVEHDFAHDKA